MESAILTLVLAVGVNPDLAAARADRAQFPEADWWCYSYLTTATADDEQRATLDAAILFAAPSLSSKTNLDQQLPVRVTPTLWRLDLRGLGWENVWYKVILAQYPYAPHLTKHGHIPFVVDGLWFAANILDPIETKDAQYQLLYSGKVPANVNDFRKFWGVSERKEFVFAYLTGKSGVKRKNDTRLLESRGTDQRTYEWESFDSLVVAGKKDPIENLLARPVEHDASELIVGIYKSLNGESGTLQAYFLANGQGVRQEFAPAALVHDRNLVRGADIANTIDCVICHTQGILPLQNDQFRGYLESGALIFADYKDKEEIERYYQTSLAKEISRNNEDYTAGVRLCNGLSPPENARALKAVVEIYDADVTVELAARQHYLRPEQFRAALAEYNERYKITGRVALLANDVPISRDTYKENYHLIRDAVFEYGVKR